MNLMPTTPAFTKTDQTFRCITVVTFLVIALLAIPKQVEAQNTTQKGSEHTNELKEWKERIKEYIEDNLAKHNENPNKFLPKHNENPNKFLARRHPNTNLKKFLSKPHPNKNLNKNFFNCANDLPEPPPSITHPTKDQCIIQIEKYIEKYIYNNLDKDSMKLRHDNVLTSNEYAMKLLYIHTLTHKNLRKLWHNHTHTHKINTPEKKEVETFKDCMVRNDFSDIHISDFSDNYLSKYPFMHTLHDMLTFFKCHRLQQVINVK